MIRHTNFHTHTKRCNHAMGSDEQYVKTAIKNGYEILGFSDHSCWNYKSGFRPHVRMQLKEFANYKSSILALKKKYQDKIELRFGMEAEYFPDMMDWMLDFCIEEDIDYLILGNHYYLSDEKGVYFGSCASQFIPKYFETCIAGMKTGMYAYLCHPELICRNVYLQWNDVLEEGFHSVCRCAKELDIPLEWNALGMQWNERMGMEAYPNHRFWQIASQYHNKAIVGMDAHNPSDLGKDIYLRAMDRLSHYDVEIVEDIGKIDYKKLKQ